MTRHRTTIVAVAAWLTAACTALAQQAPATPITDAAKQQAQQAAQEPITKVNVLKMNATIQAIDSTKRIVTLRDEMGNEDEFSVGPDMKRFDELKVGQKLVVTYYESLVLQVLRPGEQGLGSSTESALTRGKGALPAATLASQDRRTVTVKSVDPSVPSVTVTTEDGRTVTRKIEDKTLLNRVKPGDRIDITFTRAMITAIE
jgi:Cu/Ag efflux protein CusF